MPVQKPFTNGTSTVCKSCTGGNSSNACVIVFINTNTFVPGRATGHVLEPLDMNTTGHQLMFWRIIITTFVSSSALGHVLTLADVNSVDWHLKPSIIALEVRLKLLPEWGCRLNFEQSMT
ncbi:unnamed protein product [Urochloa humidicola]